MSMNFTFDNLESSSAPTLINGEFNVRLADGTIVHPSEEVYQIVDSAYQVQLLAKRLGTKDLPCFSVTMDNTTYRRGVSVHLYADAWCSLYRELAFEPKEVEASPVSDSVHVGVEHAGVRYVAVLDPEVAVGLGIEWTIEEEDFDYEP